MVMFIPQCGHLNLYGSTTSGNKDFAACGAGVVVAGGTVAGVVAGAVAAGAWPDVASAAKAWYGTAIVESKTAAISITDLFIALSFSTSNL